MTGREWDDYVEWSGLDEGRLDEIMRDRGRTVDRGSGAGPDPVARARWFPQRCRCQRRREPAIAGPENNAIPRTNPKLYQLPLLPTS